ncbi:LysR family transcriptional regulator [Bradyrhizobium elkanii]|uniref:LysR family transcriptional regulator n=1 Tax=Bradyrhizobium elkanii TaxID=29448 RepID=UPI003F7C3B67
MAVFIRAVDLGSFAAAADALEMSAPMVGKHVRFLEQRLGVRLLHRTTRRQSLTDSGQAYYERCRIVLGEAEAADALASDQSSQPRGRLRVTMPALLGRYCIVPTLLKLAQKYPAIELDLAFGDPIADLMEGGYDLAIRTGELNAQSGVIARRIARQRMVVCGSRAYLKAHGRPRTLDELGRHQLIVYRRSGRVRPWLFPRDGLAPHEVWPAGAAQVRRPRSHRGCRSARLGAGVAALLAGARTPRHRRTGPRSRRQRRISLRLPRAVAADAAIAAQGPACGGCTRGHVAEARGLAPRP